MSDNLNKVIIDLSKPAGQQESIVPLTPEEIAQRELDAAQAEAERLAQEQAQAELEATKAAAKSKLEALGLTPEEIAAITGA